MSPGPSLLSAPACALPSGFPGRGFHLTPWAIAGRVGTVPRRATGLDDEEAGEGGVGGGPAVGLVEGRHELVRGHVAGDGEEASGAVRLGH